MNRVVDWFREGLSSGKRKRGASSPACSLSRESNNTRNPAERLDFGDAVVEKEPEKAPSGKERRVLETPSSQLAAHSQTPPDERSLYTRDTLRKRRYRASITPSTGATRLAQAPKSTVWQRRAGLLQPVTPLDVKTAFGRETDPESGGPFRLADGRNNDPRSRDEYLRIIQIHKRMSKMKQQKDVDRTGAVIDLTFGTEDGAPKAEPISRPKSAGVRRQASHHRTNKPKASLAWFKPFAEEFEDGEERNVVDVNRASGSAAKVNGRGTTTAQSKHGGSTPMHVRLAREESEQVSHASERAGRLTDGRSSSAVKKIKEKDGEIEELERKLAQFRLQREKRAEEESVAQPEARVRTAVSIPPGGADRYGSLVSGSGCPTEVLVEHPGSNIALTRHDMATLAPGCWLNDEVINLSMSLLQERDAAARQEGKGEKYPKTHFFPTFFCNKLYKDGGYDYNAVRRWTTPKRLKATGQASSCLLDCDLIVVPVHLGVHWTCAAIDLAARELRYYDAMLGKDERCLEALACWLRDEYRDKRKEDREDVLSWKRSFPQSIPRQLNGWDCGMFLIQFADHLGRGAELKFTQADMAAFRIKAVLDLMNLQIS